VTKLLNKNKYLIVLFLFCSLGCQDSSEEAKAAGFKSDKEFESHLLNLNKKRDRELKEDILLLSNLDNFESIEIYLESLKTFSFHLRRYISQDGKNFNLIVAAKKLIQSEEDIKSVQENNEKAKSKFLDCVTEIDSDPNDNEYAKAAYQISLLLCNMKAGGDAESINTSTRQSFLASCRRLANLPVSEGSEEKANELFNEFFREEVQKQLKAIKAKASETEIE
jgi:hypothetical protein